jgi:hypothetical protein
MFYQNSWNVTCYLMQLILGNSSLNVFEDGAVVLLFKFWTFSIVSLF